MLCSENSAIHSLITLYKFSFNKVILMRLEIALTLLQANI